MFTSMTAQAGLPRHQVNTISSAVTVTVTPGAGNYAATLTVTGTGSILPAAAGANAVYGSVAGISLLNEGSIAGAAAGYAGGYPVAGGIGIDLTAAGTITNAGTVAGGAGSTVEVHAGSGGAGISMAGGTLANSGMISGGAGGSAYDYAASGGNGVDIVAGAVINAGTIEGGSSGGGYYGGAGAAGVALTGSTLVNYGRIAAANGGNGYNAGNGGVGVLVNSSVLINAGTISGGAAGAGYYAGRAGNAVQFGGQAGTLGIEAGAVFDGNVVADSGVDDVLVLLGAKAGVLTGLGTQFIDFGTVVENAGATWKLTGANTLGAETATAIAGHLSIDGTLLSAGTTGLAASGRLAAAAGSSVLLGTLQMNGGVLSEATTAIFAIGTTLAGVQTGALTVEAGAQILGSGDIGGTHVQAVVDNGVIAADNGMLRIGSAVTGTGTLALDQGATLHLGNSVTVASLLFQAGGSETLFLAAPKSFIAPITGFAAGDTIDLHGIKAGSLSFDAGTLSLLADHGQTIVDTLVFDGGYSQTGFSLSSDGHGGTNLTYGSSDPAPLHALLPGLLLHFGGLA